MTRPIEQQILFIRELDKLKTIIRKSRLDAMDRRENTAEHSWHAAMAALVLEEYAPAGTDVARAVKMLLVHDIVEIDADDTYAYDEDANASKVAREMASADRIFGLLPTAQSDEFRALWDEFEAIDTPDARFANAVDQLMPILHNEWAEGGTWVELKPTYEQVMARSQRRVQSSGADALWGVVRAIIAKAVAKGWLQPPTTGDNI